MYNSSIYLYRVKVYIPSDNMPKKSELIENQVVFEYIREII